MSNIRVYSSPGGGTWSPHLLDELSDEVIQALSQAAFAQYFGRFLEDENMLSESRIFSDTDAEELGGLLDTLCQEETSRLLAEVKLIDGKEAGECL